MCWDAGYEYALDAVRLLLDRGVACAYRIVGDGDYAAAFAFARDQLDLDDVTELVPPDVEALSAHIRWADVYLSPGLVDGGATTLAHAQAAGLPVVATSVVEGAAFVVPRRDSNALAASLEQLARDPTRRRIGAAARAAPELISVIIPVLNGEEHLGEQLEALASQTYQRPWEVVIVDNGCTDGTLTVVEGWRKRLPPLRVADATARRGINHARNVGVVAARGDFLAFCDADDVATTGWLEALAEAATSADIVDGVVDLATLDRQALLPLPPDGTYGGLTLEHGFLPGVCGGNCGMWRSVAEELGWNEAFAFGSSDIEFSWRAALGCYTMEAAPKALVHKRPRGGLRALARQWWSYGESDAQLYRHFRHIGMPRRDTATALREWTRLIRRCPDLLRSAKRRAFWVTQAARSAGRIRGSIRYRVMFL
jgi:hypothetical protein